MSTYAIGDLQGCFDSLMQLLKKIEFNPKKDNLWFTGDLVNRGPQSLETLRFIRSLGKRAITVLGNHDLTLLAVATGAVPYEPQHHTFEDILNAPDKQELIHWLRQQPLLYHDTQLGYTLVHAGLHPSWDLELALTLAKEAEIAIQDTASHDFFIHMYGNEPECWDPKLKGFDRLRFIVNCFTRLRFCSPDGKLELLSKESAGSAPKGYMPWFEVQKRLNQPIKILFGHWAALQGFCTTPNVFPLDTGCVWGGCLTAMRLEDNVKWKVECSG